MYELTIEEHFSAAHNLREYNGECERLHGHNWRVEVRVKARELGEGDMVMDFRHLKDVVRETLKPIDHSYLNELPPFDELNPTTENLCRHIALQVAERLPERVRIERVCCWESDKCGACYFPEGDPGDMR